MIDAFTIDININLIKNTIKSLNKHKILSSQEKEVKNKVVLGLKSFLPILEVHRVRTKELWKKENMTYQKVFELGTIDKKKYKKLYDNDKVNYMLLRDISSKIVMIIKNVKILFIKAELNKYEKVLFTHFRIFYD